MNTTGGGGYILHAIRVHDDPKASSALTGFRKRIRLQRIAKKKEGEGSGEKDIKMSETNSESVIDEDMDSIDSDT
jgi:hypothetical protein